MPRARPLPTDDCLLSAAEAGAICKVSRSRWDAYAARFPALIRGRRLVQATPGGRGTMRFLKSAVIEHLHCELARERPARPVLALHGPDDAGAGARPARSGAASATPVPSMSSQAAAPLARMNRAAGTVAGVRGLHLRLTE